MARGSTIWQDFETLRVVRLMAAQRMTSGGGWAHAGHIESGATVEYCGGAYGGLSSVLVVKVLSGSRQGETLYIKEIQWRGALAQV